VVIGGGGKTGIPTGFGVGRGIATVAESDAIAVTG
jgi:hypothetical protein